MRPDGTQYVKVWRTKEGSFLKKNLPEDNDRYLTGLGNYIDYIVDIEVLEHIAMGMGFAPRASATTNTIRIYTNSTYTSVLKPKLAWFIATKGNNLKREFSL